MTAHLTDETSSDAPASASLAPTYTPGKIPPPFSSPLSVSTRNGDDGRKSTDSRDSEDLHSPPEMVATWDPALDGLFKSQPGIGRGITETTRLLAVDVTKDRPVDASGIDPIEAPETGRATMCDLEGKKDWSAEEERERLRQYWESKGYLPNPILGEVARMQKKRALWVYRCLVESSTSDHSQDEPWIPGCRCGCRHGEKAGHVKVCPYGVDGEHRCLSLRPEYKAHVNRSLGQPSVPSPSSTAQRATLSWPM